MFQSKCSKILEAIDQKFIRDKIVSPCRYAEASYKTKHVFPKKFSELQKDCAEYWKYLFQSYYKAPMDNHPFGDAYNRACEIIEKAFYKQGGMRYAFFKAQHETFNSVKFQITNFFIEDATERYVSSVLNTYVDPTSYAEIEQLMKEYIKKFNVKLEKYGDLQFMIANYEIILKSHAKRHSQLEIDRHVGAIVG